MVQRIAKNNAQTYAKGSRIPASATEFLDLFTIILTPGKPKAPKIFQKYATMCKIFQSDTVDRAADKTLYLLFT